MGGINSKAKATNNAIKNSDKKELKITEVMPNTLWFSDNNRLIWNYAFDIEHHNHTTFAIIPN